MTTGTDFPSWLNLTAAASLVIAGACSLVIVHDLVRRPEKMAVMNIVWPVTALFGSVLWLVLYYHSRSVAEAGTHDETPMGLATAKAATHCGAGCTLGDILVEWAAFAVPAIAGGFGWHWLFAEKTFAVWIADYVVAFLIGIAFQYFTLQPMRHLPPGKALLGAIKADAASITAWQVGMYGAMAIAQFALLKPAYGRVAPVDTPVFWFVMQIAMLAGFVTSYPVNWLLIRSSVKERM